MKNHYLCKKNLLDEFNKSMQQEQMTEEFGYLLMLLIERISKKKNWRSYSYLDDMCSFALTLLLKENEDGDPYWTKFDEDFADKEPYYRRCPRTHQIINITAEEYKTFSKQEKRKWNKRYSNPFAYYTTAIENAFKRYLFLERREHLDVRDILLENNNCKPSFYRQQREQKHGRHN